MEPLSVIVLDLIGWGGDVILWNKRQGITKQT